jgi:predicted helicase
VSFAQYLKEIEKELRVGHATEHTHRPALKTLIESIDNKITATNEPKRIECGAPDFIVTRVQTPLGYIEAKGIGKPLDVEERSEQMSRYYGLGNVVLTDYLEFRWYVYGEKRLTARCARVGNDGKLTPDKNGEAEVRDLLTRFFSQTVETIVSAKDLAKRMAHIAQLIREITRLTLTAEDKSGSLHDEMKAFRDVLLHDLSEDQFADMYAQTICYGLFAARCNARGGKPFTREHAAYDLPKTNPFLRQMFSHIAGPDLDDRIAWVVDDLAELLRHVRISEILQDFGKRTRQQDPVVHFYETFLAAYDPKLRETRGVYYTPEPVVSYIARSVDHILKTDFQLKAGLADASKITLRKRGSDETIESHKVLILDPATGTGTFLYGVINLIFDSFKRNRGMWSAYVSEHLLPRLFGFELLMAPYAVAHLKLGLQLDRLKYDFATDERLRVYLTNTLEEVHQLTNADAFTRWLTEEADAASKVKQERPVMVVLGNPPYSGHSANTGKWIANLLRGRDTQTGKEVANYFEVDGQPLGERNPKWLNDDYVKFIRFAQWRIEQTGYGVLAFITNHGYLDNPTFRGMRQSLMETFDDIHVLDLHGNSKKKESAPDGSKDENVFDIQQGVAIGLFVKRGGSKKRPATVRHAHLWGMREIYQENVHGEQTLSGGKYYWLWRHDVSATNWAILEPQSPSYLFVPQDADLRGEYEQGWKVTEIMPVHGPGMTTARDHVVIDFEAEPILERVKLFRDSTETNEELCRQLDIPVKKGWDVTRARKLIKAEQKLDQYIKPVLYRPFDTRLIFYHDSLVWRTVKQTMGHMLAGQNLALITTRQTRDEWHVLASNQIMGHKSLAAYDINSLAPLYLYATGESRKLFEDKLPASIASNLAKEFITDFAARLQLTFIPDGKGDRVNTFGPEDIFDYMYAVFHSPTYRSRYAEFLKTDFPRLPLTSNSELFRSLCVLGEELVALHLMTKHGSDIASFPIDGDNRIETVRYTAPGEHAAKEGRVWINSEQYFEGVPAEIWNFHVGGYQVCQKWLKDRKGRELSYDDMQHYKHIVAALSDTIRLMSDIDSIIEKNGGWPIN